MQRTGVDIVDRAVGGLLPGLPLIVAGASGSGRTVLALQLTRAALDNGEVVAYLCNEPSPFLLQQAATLGLPLEEAVETGQLVLCELDPMVASLVRAHGCAALMDAARAEEPLATTLVIDPVTAFWAEMHDAPALRTETRALVRAASPMKMVLSAETEQLALQKGLDRVLAEVAGSFLSLHRDERGRRSLRVEKSRSGVAEAEYLELEIGEGGLRCRETPPESALPVPASAPAREPVEAPAPPPSLLADPEKERKVVLVVDDDRFTRTLLSKWLEADYEVVCARDGFEAMTAVATRRPDLVVLDLIMPRITGYELLAAFQRLDDDVPLLVISSRLQRPADRIGPLVLGATDLLPKPVDRFELLHKVEILLRLQGSPRRSLDVDDAEALFASIGESRKLDSDAFRARLERACRFGERHGMPSSLVGLSLPSAACADALERVADRQLRFEDALLRPSRRRVLLLLVAIEPADASAVVERLLADEWLSGQRPDRVEWRVHAAQPTGARGDWHAYFRDDADEEGA